MIVESDRRFGSKQKISFVSEGGLSGFAYCDIIRQSMLVDDMLVPNFFVILIPATPDRPSIEIEADLVEGRFVCTKVRFTELPTGSAKGISGRDLARLPLERLIIDAAGMMSKPVEVGAAEDGSTMIRVPISPGSLTGTQKRRLVATRPRRGRPKRAPLEEVADAYSRRGKLEDIQEQFGVSRSTAIRRLREARDKGLVPPR